MMTRMSEIPQMAALEKTALSSAAIHVATITPASALHDSEDRYIVYLFLVAESGVGRG